MTNTTIATQEDVHKRQVAIYESQASILRPSTAKVPIAGKIACGIMVLKNRYNEATKKKDLPPLPRDQQIYDKMFAEGKSWDDIKKAVGKDDEGKDKLRPANIDHFFFRPGDFTNPDNAQELIDKYGDEKDGLVRGFPLAFAYDDWWDNIESSYTCYGFEGMQFQSRIEVKYVDAEAIVERFCCVPPPVKLGRPSGEIREWQHRPNTKEYACDGLCKPGVCPEYQRRDCNGLGIIRAYIAGISGHGMYQITTRSIPAMNRMAKTLFDVKNDLGRIRMLHHKGECILWLRKTLTTMHQVDPKTGKVSKRKQWIPVLDYNYSYFDLVVAAEELAARERERGQAVKALMNGERITQEQKELIAETRARQPEKVAPAQSCIILGASTTEEAATESPEIESCFIGGKKLTREQLFEQVCVAQDRLKGFGREIFEKFRATNKIYKSSAAGDIQQYLYYINQEIDLQEMEASKGSEPAEEDFTGDVIDVGIEEGMDTQGSIPEEDDVPL